MVKITVEDLREALPAHLKSSATQSLADQVNNITSDPEYARGIRDNIIGYTGVLKDSRFRVEDYLNAVAYVSFKLMNFSNQEAYKKAFPQRYAALVAQGADEKTISSYVAMYTKGKLVNLIMEQTLVPTWVLNQDAYQQAINTQMLLMTTSKSDMVRTQAANSLLTHLKKPEKAVVELSLGESETEGMRKLTDSMTRLAEQQLALIQAGVNTQSVAHHKLGDTITIEARPLPSYDAHGSSKGRSSVTTTVIDQVDDAVENS
jgi:hypothetical protein